MKILGNDGTATLEIEKRLNRLQNKKNKNWNKIVKHWQNNKKKSTFKNVTKRHLRKMKSIIIKKRDWQVIFEVGIAEYQEHWPKIWKPQNYCLLSKYKKETFKLAKYYMKIDYLTVIFKLFTHKLLSWFLLSHCIYNCLWPSSGASSSG